MTNEEAIKYLRQLYPQGGHCWLDEQRMEAINMAVESLSHSVTKTSDKDKIRAEIKTLNTDIDKCISDLLAARGKRDKQGIAAAHWRMETLMVNTMQICSMLIDSMQEEPASKDLKTEMDKYICDNFTVEYEQLYRFGIEPKDYMYSLDKSDMLAMARHFANWQKQQFEKNRLAACDAQTEQEANIEQDFVIKIIKKEHRQPTFDDAIKYGMKLQREQMMAKAINTEASLTMSVPSICISLPLGVNVGDKVKVIVIKED